MFVYNREVAHPVKLNIMESAYAKTVVLLLPGILLNAYKVRNVVMN